MTTRRVELEYAATGGAALETRFRSLGDTGERAMTRLRGSVEPVNPALRAVDAAAGQARSQLEGLSAQAGPLGGVLRAVGPAGLVASAGLAAVGMATAAMVRHGETAERQQLRLQGVLRATAYASGQTAAEIERMAVALGRDTLGGVSEARDVAARLLLRPEIGPEIFERTLRVSQDLAEVMGRDLAGAAEMVGRAMSSPIRGMESLNEAGIMLTQQQREQIRLWEESGELARAQAYLLEILEQRVGGTGSAAGGGLTGAWGTLNTNIALYIERSAAALGLTERLKEVIDTLAKGAGRMADDMVADHSAREIEAATAARIRLEDELERARRGEFNSPVGVTDAAAASIIASIEEDLAKAQALEARLLAEARERGQREREEQEQAEAGRAAALAEQRAQQLLTIEKRLQDERLALRENAAERIRQAEARELEQLQNLRAQAEDPEEQARIDQAIADRRALTERQIAGLTQASEDAARRRAEAEAARAAQQEERNLKVLDGLEREIELLDIVSERERARLQAQDRAVARLTDPSAEAEARARQLAGQAFDAEQGQRDQQETLRLERRLQLVEAERELIGVSGSTRRIALAVLQQEISLKERGVDLTSDQAQRELELAERLAQTAEEVGRQRAAYDLLESSAERAFDRIGGSMTQMFMEGEDAAISWQNTVNAVLSEIMQTMLQLAVMNPLKNALFGGDAATLADMGGILGDLFHGGGIAGESAVPRRSVPAALFVGAPRYHRGGLVGDEIPAILRRGEEVLTENDPRHRRNAGGGVQVTIINNAPVRVQQRERQGPNGMPRIDLVIDEVAAAGMQRPGSASSKALRESYGAQPRLTNRG